jgi:hypothetical protein
MAGRDPGGWGGPPYGELPPELQRVHRDVRRLRRRLRAPRSAVPEIAWSRGDGSPHVELVDGHLELVSCERGREFWRDRAADHDDLLFRVAQLLAAARVRSPPLWRVLARPPRGPAEHRAAEARLLGRVRRDWAERHLRERA